MEKKLENPPGNFSSMLPIIRCTDSYSAGSKYHFTGKDFPGLSDFGGLAVRLSDF